MEPERTIIDREKLLSIGMAGRSTPRKVTDESTPTSNAVRIEDAEGVTLNIQPKTAEFELRSVAE